MHKDGRWAREILQLQKPEGHWGYFHTLSETKKFPVTTEQALRRLEILGYTLEDEPIARAVVYMLDCLEHRREIPDRREKLHDWDVFTDLMLAAWIRRFTGDCPAANRVAERWAGVITKAFAAGEYDSAAYIRSYENTFGLKPAGGRLMDFVSFYQISLLIDALDEKTERAMVTYVLNHEAGIYYLYEKILNRLPESFASREANRYLSAVELLAEYRSGRESLHFVADWLEEQQNDRGMWDMGSLVKDQIQFPLSDSWRKADTRESDCTERVCRILNRIG